MMQTTPLGEPTFHFGVKLEAQRALDHSRTEAPLQWDSRNGRTAGTRVQLNCSRRSSPPVTTQETVS